MRLFEKVVESKIIPKDRILKILSQDCPGNWLDNEDCFGFNSFNNTCSKTIIDNDGENSAPSPYDCLQCWTRECR